MPDHNPADNAPRATIAPVFFKPGDYVVRVIETHEFASTSPHLPPRVRIVRVVIERVVASTHTSNARGDFVEWAVHAEHAGNFAPSIHEIRSAGKATKVSRIVHSMATKGPLFRLELPVRPVSISAR